MKQANQRTSETSRRAELKHMADFVFRKVKTKKEREKKTKPRGSEKGHYMCGFSLWLSNPPFSERLMTMMMIYTSHPAFEKGMHVIITIMMTGGWRNAVSGQSLLLLSLLVHRSFLSGGKVENERGGKHEGVGDEGM